MAGAEIVYEGTVSGGVTASATVSTSSAVPAAEGHLYLAAVTIRTGKVSVRSIGGLGLTWALAKVQCAGRNQGRVEVWYALGTAEAPSRPQRSNGRRLGDLWGLPIALDVKPSTDGNGL